MIKHIPILSLKMFTFNMSEDKPVWAFPSSIHLPVPAQLARGADSLQTELLT